MSDAKKINVDEAQAKFQESIKKLSDISDFKEYFKEQREIIKDYVGTWQFVEEFQKHDTEEQYRLLIKSFSQKNELDKEQGKSGKEKDETIAKFDKQINDFLDKKDFSNSSRQLFYVLLGNLIDHTGNKDVDLEKFDLEKDLYPKIKTPALSISFFLFQNMIFGPISEQINALSKEYMQKYFALLLGLWRSVFEFMAYERHQEDEKNKQKNEEKVVMDEKTEKETKK
jgi:hypothetical protein